MPSGKNLLKIDPTRTELIRKAMIGKLMSRFKALKKFIRQMITRHDLATESPAVFKKWLRGTIEDLFFGPRNASVWRRFITESFKKGLGRAYDCVKNPVNNSVTKKNKRLVRNALTTNAKKWPIGKSLPETKEEFIESSFNTPVSKEKLDTLSDNMLDELDDMTEDMVDDIEDVLYKGLKEGTGAEELADEINDEIGMSESRAETIARTEIIRSHADGQLEALEGMGIKQVGAEVEFRSTDDNAVCEECEDLNEEIYDIEEARGVIPVHPNCRCAWLPYVPDEEDEDEKEEP